ncbi:hydantoinase B/oxoprolinase family protein [soil metagenome]
MRDVVTTEIIRNLFVSAAEDMFVTLVRSAFQPLIYENQDVAVALLDRNADVLGQSSGLPMFLGSLDAAVKESLQVRGGPTWLAEGDIVCLNDPYIQGTHLTDVTVFGPVHHNGLLVGYVATRGDVTDLGGRDPGGGTATTEVYQEGLRLGPVKICTAAGPVHDVIDIIRRNSRSGGLAVGDINAMIAACRTGQRRMLEILDRFGLECVEAARDEIFGQSEAADRATVAAIPDGVYTGRGMIDNDGIDINSAVTIPISITVNGTELSVDLTHSPDSTVGPINCGRAQAVAAIRVAYKLLFAPDRSFDGGCFRNVEVHTRPGSIHHALEPAACAWYYTTLGLLIDMFVSAFAEVLPDRATAAQFGDSMVTYFAGADPRDSAKRYLCVEAHAGGWGASAASDGVDGVINVINGGFRNTPVEAFESRYPISVTHYGVRSESGGIGHHRGGNGIDRGYRFEQPTQVFMWLDRSRTPAWGLCGGSAGLPPRVEISGSVERTDLLKANGIWLQPGDTVRILTGGGGGFGHPSP